MPPPAFSTVALLDDFNRANEAPLSNGGKWSLDPKNTASGQWNLVSNQAAPAGSFDSAMYWNTSFAANQEVWADIVAPNWFALYARGINPHAAGFGAYEWAIDNGTSTVIRLYKTVSGTVTQLGTDVNQTVVNGDGMGMVCRGGNIDCYYRSTASGAWQRVLTVADATFTAAGVIGIQSGAPSTIIDNFYGGSSVPALRPVRQNVPVRRVAVY